MIAAEYPRHVPDAGSSRPIWSEVERRWARSVLAERAGC
jgi:hypothetical protein